MRDVGEYLVALRATLVYLLRCFGLKKIDLLWDNSGEMIGTERAKLG